MFRFLHAADIHLDSPLRGLSRFEDAPTELLRQASRRAFDRLIDVAIEQEVKFLVLAGDLFDGEWKDYNTGKFFVDRMRRLQACEIRVYTLRGNHDAESRLTKSLDLPSNVEEFKTRKGSSFDWPELGVTLHGCSYADAATVTNLTPQYPKAREDRLNIGVLHTALGNEDSGHANYAPCSLDDLKDKGYDYWALGHVHQRQILCEDPWIVFSGNLQGRHVRETGAKGATLVTVDGGKVTAVESLELDVLRWAVIEVDLEGLADEESVLEQVSSSFARAIQKADDRPLAARLVLTGACAFHDALLLESERIELNLRNLAAEIGDSNLWIEKIRIETQPARSVHGEGSLGQLARSICDTEISEETLQRRAKELQNLAKKLNKSDLLEQLNPTDFDDLRHSYSEAKDYLAALLNRESERDSTSTEVGS